MCQQVEEEEGERGSQSSGFFFIMLRLASTVVKFTVVELVGLGFTKDGEGLF